MRHQAPSFNHRCQSTGACSVLQTFKMMIHCARIKNFINPIYLSNNSIAVQDSGYFSNVINMFLARRENCSLSDNTGSPTAAQNGVSNIYTLKIVHNIFVGFNEEDIFFRKKFIKIFNKVTQMFQLYLVFSLFYQINT